MPIVLYIGTARNAAGMKYVNRARFITVRPPCTLSRLIANAAAVAISKRQHAGRHGDRRSEFQSCSQKWLEVVVLLAEHHREVAQASDGPARACPRTPIPSAKSRTGTGGRSAAASTAGPGMPIRSSLASVATAAQRRHAHLESRFIMKNTSGSTSGSATHDRRHGEVDLVEPQVADAERGQHVGQVRRTAARQEVNAVEIAERPDHREDRRGQIERAASTARSRSGTFANSLRRRRLRPHRGRRESPSRPPPGSRSRTAATSRCGRGSRRTARASGR